MEKLKMGDEIYVYLEGGHEYLSYESENGYEDQTFNSSEYPTKVKAAYLWNEEDYEVYAFMEIPYTLREFYIFGETGFKNSVEELDKIIETTIKGKAEDGREILHPRSINIDDINKIAGVKPDFEKGIVYQEKEPKENIDFGGSFGYSRKIRIYELKRITFRFIKGISLKSTAYYYSIKDLNIEKYKKEILNIGFEYYLASQSIHLNNIGVYFCNNVIIKGDVVMSACLFDLDGNKNCISKAIRPVFKLKSTDNIK